MRKFAFHSIAVALGIQNSGAEPQRDARTAENFKDRCKSDPQDPNAVTSLAERNAVAQFHQTPTGKKLLAHSRRMTRKFKRGNPT